MSIGVHFEDDKDAYDDTPIGGLHDMDDYSAPPEPPKGHLIQEGYTLARKEEPKPFVLSRKDYNDLVTHLKSLWLTDISTSAERVYYDHGLSDVFDVLEEYGIYVKDPRRPGRQEKHARLLRRH